MRLSQTDKDKLLDLTIEQKTQIVYGDYKDEGLSGEVALLLGGRPSVCPARSAAAAKLYHDGRVKYIVPSGGVEWDHDGVMISEANYMKTLLMEMNVPEDAIITENVARTTKENMICGTLTINREIDFYNVSHVIVVTSASHLRRSLALANIFLPRTVKISGFPTMVEEGLRDQWFKTERHTKAVDNEVRLLKKLIDGNMIDDIEY